MPVLRPERRLLLWLLAAFLVLGAGIGLREPTPPDEPRFAMMAQDMVDTGNWLVPHRGSEIYAEKPPVFMWMQASAYAAVGDLRIAFLLPSLLAGVLTLW
ncbi:MAG: ArnT family glycosyltransferase, partial [Silanimonas sp.]